MMEALRAGNRRAFAAALFADVPDAPPLADLPPLAVTALERAANVAIELRRESVHLINDHEVFVRRTPKGGLRRVVGRVTLSLHDGTLWQPSKRRYNEATRKWEDEIIDPGQASLTYPGYCAVNAIAGCVVAQPATVRVDEETRTNPFIERSPRGDIVRVVIEATVAGCSPATGNIALVNYKLDYDPSKDLLHMLSGVAKGEKGDLHAYLCGEDDKLEAGWRYVPLYGGVGYAVNLRSPDVLRKYSEFVNILGNAVKKAQTVVRRNAMRNHPAFNVHAVRIDNKGTAAIPVTGWAMDEHAQAAWAEVLRGLAEGQRVDPTVLDVEVQDVHEVYDPDRDGREGDVAEGVVPLDGDAAPAPASAEASARAADLEEKNALIAEIDGVINQIRDPGDVVLLRYDPDKNTLGELRSILASARTIAAGQGES